MKIHHKVRSVYWVAASIIIIGAIASMGAFWAAKDSVNDTSLDLLKGDAGQGSLVMSELVNSEFVSPMMQLGKLVTPIGVAPATFEAGASGLSKATGASIALLREVGGHLQTVASVGVVRHAFGTPSDDDAILSLSLQANANFPGTLVSGGQRWLEEDFGKGYVPAGYIIYVEQPLGKTNQVTNLPGFLFHNTVAGVYVGSISTRNLVLATAKNVDRYPKEAISVIDTSSELGGSSPKITNQASSFVSRGHLLVAMSQTTNLAGTFAENFPGILLLGGLLATLTFAWLMSLAVARRDRALGFVDELKLKNAELDDALSRQAQAELRLRQAQRMEAVGQLAGGIAHDFNNLLQSIISYSEFLSEAIDPESDMQQDVAEVRKAALRAAELTRQLLVFSRQDITTPTVIDLNDIVRDSQRFLQHTLGEDVRLKCRTSKEPRCVLADSGELELMLMNLAINSRDAMPNGGELAITVDSSQFDVVAAQQAGVVPGHYALLKVTDNGDGMAPEVAAKAFEPFFTTKETGRGTGLGLAMVYGITTRWGGSASISTAVGAGTTVTLMFPLSGEEPATVQVEPPRVLPKGDRDVILLVEDQDAVRRSTARILEAAGYEVLQSPSGVEAMESFTSVPIDLLVTDVIMPGGVSGKQLADHLLATQPELPVIFVTGYSSEIIAERGILPPSTNLVMKPFSPEEILEAVAHALSHKVGAR